MILLQVQERLLVVELLRGLQDFVAAEAPVDLQAREAEDQNVEERKRNLQHQDHGSGGQGDLRLPDPGHVDTDHLLGSLCLHPQVGEGRPLPGGEGGQIVRRFTGKRALSFAKIQGE
jgi:hypothetical protein